MAKKMNKILNREIEARINSILFKLCLFVTLITVAMMLVGFFSRGSFPPTKISLFYISVLLIYSVHKEALRWIEEKGAEKHQRNGEYFVYSWIVLTTLLYLINFLTKDYFSVSASGQSAALTEITFTTIEVCAVFIFTRLFKIFSLRFLK